jgi:hypothetical protein
MGEIDNPTDGKIRELYENIKTIAVVGLSPDTSRESYKVASYLRRQGYRVIPVNPTCEDVFGETCYPDLKSVPEKVDVVDIFRKQEAVPEVVEEALTLEPEAIWLQKELVYPGAEKRAEEKNILYVQSRCMKEEHERLYSS